MVGGVAGSWESNASYVLDLITPENHAQSGSLAVIRHSVVGINDLLLYFLPCAYKCIVNGSLIQCDTSCT